MNEINITSAQYATDPLTGDTGKLIKVTIDGTEMWVSIDPANRHYAEIMRQVAAGTLTIEDAD
tara:strand:- start:1 stop:189 length:189 start_codon:yes stop_codon:yes gene_type:complete